MNNFSPVLIPTLNRFTHFRNCVESLALCTHANQTDLFIALDYPSKESHFEGYEQIKNYLPTIVGFKKVIIIKRERNWGASENIYDAIETIFNQYERLIISEDDNVFAPNFLDYMNKGLSLFEFNSKVSSVCGYKFPFEGPQSFPHNYMYSKSFSGWGYGFWREKYTDKVWLDNKEQALSEVRKFLKNPLNAYRVYKAQKGLLESLMKMVQKKEIKADGMHCFYNLKKNSFSIFPKTSLVRNTGHDGSGENCNIMNVNSNPFIKQRIDVEKSFEFKEHYKYENKFVNSSFSNYFTKYHKMRFHHKVFLAKDYLSFFLFN